MQARIQGFSTGILFFGCKRLYIQVPQCIETITAVSALPGVLQMAWLSWSMYGQRNSALAHHWHKNSRAILRVP
jgi:hypothetical protein